MPGLKRDLISLPIASAVAFNNGEIQYYTAADPVYFETDNRPLKNLAHRDNLIATSADSIIAEINDARADKDTLADRLSQSMNDDGSIKISAIPAVKNLSISVADILRRNQNDAYQEADEKRKKSASGMFAVKFKEDGAVLRPGGLFFDASFSDDTLKIGQDSGIMRGYNFEVAAKDLVLSAAPLTGTRMDFAYLLMREDIAHTNRLESTTTVILDTSTFSDNAVDFQAAGVLAEDLIVILGKSYTVKSVTDATNLEIYGSFDAAGVAEAYIIYSSGVSLYIHGYVGDGAITDVTNINVRNTVFLSSLGLWVQRRLQYVIFDNLGVDFRVKPFEDTNLQAPGTAVNFSKDSSGIFVAVDASSFSGVVYAMPIARAHRMNQAAWSDTNHNGGSGRPDSLLFNKVYSDSVTDMRTTIGKFDQKELKNAGIFALLSGSLMQMDEEIIKDSDGNGITAPTSVFGTKILMAECIAGLAQDSSKEVLFRSVANNGLSNKSDGVRQIWSDKAFTQEQIFETTAGAATESHPDWTSTANSLSRTLTSGNATIDIVDNGGGSFTLTDSGETFAALTANGFAVSTSDLIDAGGETDLVITAVTANAITFNATAPTLNSTPYVIHGEGLESITVSVPASAAMHPQISSTPSVPIVSFITNGGFGAAIPGSWSNLDTAWSGAVPPTASVFNLNDTPANFIRFNENTSIVINASMDYPAGGGLLAYPENMYACQFNGAMLDKLVSVIPDSAYTAAIYADNSHTIDDIVMFYDKDTKRVSFGKVVKAFAEAALAIGYGGATTVNFTVSGTQRIINRANQDGSLADEALFDGASAQIGAHKAATASYAGSTVIADFPSTGLITSDIVIGVSYIPVVVSYTLQVADSAYIYYKKAAYQGMLDSGTIRAEQIVIKEGPFKLREFNKDVMVTRGGTLGNPSLSEDPYHHSIGNIPGGFNFEFLNENVDSIGDAMPHAEETLLKLSNGARRASILGKNRLELDLDPGVLSKAVRGYSVNKALDINTIVGSDMVYDIGINAADEGIAVMAFLVNISNDLSEQSDDVRLFVMSGNRETNKFDHFDVFPLPGNPIEDAR